MSKGGIRHVEDQRGDVQHTESDTVKARKELRWKPRVGFDEGLAKTIEGIKTVS